MLDGISIKQSIKWDVSYRYWITNTLEYNVHLFFLEENNSEAMSSERSLMENVLVFEDENEHQSEYSANGRPLVTVEKSTQYADQAHLAQKLNTLKSPLWI